MSRSQDFLLYVYIYIYIFAFPVKARTPGRSGARVGGPPPPPRTGRRAQLITGAVAQKGLEGLEPWFASKRGLDSHNCNNGDLCSPFSCPQGPGLDCFRGKSLAPPLKVRSLQTLSMSRTWLEELNYSFN